MSDIRGHGQQVSSSLCKSHTKGRTGERREGGGGGNDILTEGVGGGRRGHCLTSDGEAKEDVQEIMFQ